MGFVEYPGDPGEEQFPPGEFPRTRGSFVAQNLLPRLIQRLPPCPHQRHIGGPGRPASRRRGVKYQCGTQCSWISPSPYQPLIVDERFVGMTRKTCFSFLFSALLFLARSLFPFPLPFFRSFLLPAPRLHPSGPQPSDFLLWATRISRHVSLLPIPITPRCSQFSSLQPRVRVCVCVCV